MSNIPPGPGGGGQWQPPPVCNECHHTNPPICGTCKPNGLYCYYCGRGPVPVAPIPTPVDGEPDHV